MFTITAPRIWYALLGRAALELSRCKHKNASKNLLHASLNTSDKAFKSQC
jgi:hypothetical protein